MEKTVWLIDENIAIVDENEFKKLCSGYAIEYGTESDIIGYYDNYEVAFEHFSNLQPILEYDKYYEKYYLTEYILLESIEDGNGDLISHNMYLMDKKYNF